MAIRKATSLRVTAVILLAFVCLAAVGQAQEKLRAKKPTKPMEKGKKPAKAAAKGKKGKESAPHAGLKLDEEVRKKVMDDPEMAMLLSLREDLDKLNAEYRMRALTKGVKAHQKATRKLPGLRRQVEKGHGKLDALADRLLAPLEKAIQKDKDREEKLIRKMDKMDGGGRAKDVDKLEKELDDLRTSIGDGETNAELLAEIGKPEMHVAPAETLLLEELIKPNEQEEGTLRSLVKKQSNLIAARLMILHLQADLKKAKEGTKDRPANPERAKAVERLLAQAEKRFAKYFLNVWEPIAKEDRELLEEKEELEQKAADLTGRPAGRKYEQKLAAAARKLDGKRRTSTLYKRLARGTLAAKKLAEQAKKEKAKKSEGSKKKTGRRKR